MNLKIEKQDELTINNSQIKNNLMAQLDRALVYETKGWRFESFWDYKKWIVNSEFYFISKLKIDKQSKLPIDHWPFTT